MIVANHASTAFGGDDNQVTLITASGHETLPVMSKLDVAELQAAYEGEHGG